VAADAQRLEGFPVAAALYQDDGPPPGAFSQAVQDVLYFLQALAVVR